MTRRDRLDVIMDILRTIQSNGNAAKPTHIMYRANLSHTLLKNYLEELTEKGLIEEKNILKRNYIEMTNKGIKFLSELRKMKNFVESFGF